jgi:hypothetical protein
VIITIYKLALYYSFRGVNTDFFFNFSDIFLISPTSDPSDFLLNRAVRAVYKIFVFGAEVNCADLSCSLILIFAFVLIYYVKKTMPVQTFSIMWSLPFISLRCIILFIKINLIFWMQAWYPELICVNPLASHVLFYL